VENLFYGVTVFSLENRILVLTAGSSTVIHDIEGTCQSDPSISLAYWYFQFDVDEMKSVDNMTRSLIRQLSRSPLAPSVTKVWEYYSRRGSQPDSRTIANVLKDVLSSIPGEVFLVFDALDECPENAELKERGSLLRILVDLLEGYKDKIHILATSRPEQDIRLSLDQFPNLDLEAYLAEDVKIFVDSSIADSLLNRYNSATKKLIADRLLSSKERYVDTFCTLLYVDQGLANFDRPGASAGLSYKLRSLKNVILIEISRTLSRKFPRRWRLPTERFLMALTPEIHFWRAIF
jgi:hypothetical protein